MMYGQDIHWTQFNDNPLFQNPGNAGAFPEDIRFIANYRNQWRSVTVPFSTNSFSADTRYKDWGVGLLAFHDQVGDGKFAPLNVRRTSIDQSISLFYLVIPFVRA